MHDTLIPEVVSVTDEEDHLMTVSDVARRWQVSQMTVHRRIRDGTLPAITLNRGAARKHMRIRLSDVEKVEHDGRVNDDPH
jgi:excisionase family DNA binding protein